MGASAAGDYEIEQSLRFNDDDSAYLSRTPSTASNRKTWTWSGWVKRGNLGSSTYYCFYGVDGVSPNDRTEFVFTADAFEIYEEVSSTATISLKTTQLFRDPSAWYHVVIAMDTTQSTNTNRVKFYVNGEQVTSFSASTYPSLNYDTFTNSTKVHVLGARRYADGTTNKFLDGYLAEVNLIDGQALTPDSFGETGTYGEWKPIDVSGLTYGTNGFYLPMNQEGYQIDYLVVAGGGGGNNGIGGGGGAGGYRTGAKVTAPAQTYTVTVGAGGGGVGANSVFSSITSSGGGGGGPANSVGIAGGSGSGGHRSSRAGGAGNTPATIPSQGNNGGTASLYSSGGGGGASAVGGNAPSTSASGNGGVGGAGSASSITGSAVTRAGGGGGGAYQGTGGSGGSGGGGGGGGDGGGTATAGSANTGGGGGGGADSVPAGAAGGSGVVILSMLTSNYSETTTGSPTVTTSGANTILTYTSSGSYTS